MTERAMLTKGDIERARVAKLDAKALDDPFITTGIAMVAHGDDPGEAWLRVALTLAAQNRLWVKRATEEGRLIPNAPPIIMCSECPQRARLETELKQRNCSEI